MTALIPVEVTLSHGAGRVVVLVLGEPTANPALFVAPDINADPEFDDEGERLPISGWTVTHAPTRMQVVGVSFDLDDARTFANTIAHLDWADFQRGKTPAERRAHPYAAVVSAALNEVTWW